MSTMDPLRFGTARGRQLFGVHHAPSSGSTAMSASGGPAGPGVGVLFLAPFGQEAVRAHRLSRVLADRLARQGHHVLRFDYQGSGDSDGDDLDADLAAWREDVIAAHRLLRERSGCGDVRWLGFRLGFTVGLQVAATWSDADGPPPSRLVGWDPVLDGPAYLDELAAGHAAALRRSYSLPQVPAAELARLAAASEPTEALGFALSAAMVRDLRSIAIGDGLPDATRWPARTTLGAIRSRAMRRAGAASLAIEDVDVDFDWVSEEALNTPLVPDLALRRLLQLLGVGPREA